jgi:hypothetical protein
VRFTFNNLTYEVPEGVGISIEVMSWTEEIGGESHHHFDFNFVKDGDHIPMLGGTDEEGSPVESWDDVGIRKVD